MNFYLIRHGETSWNIEGRFQGCTNNCLNFTGIEQSCVASRKLKNTPIHCFYSSPLQRCYETCQILNIFHRVPIYIDNRLQERSLGVLEGKFYKDYLPSPFLTQMWDMSIPDFTVYHIETLSHLLDRTHQFLEDIFCQYSHLDINIGIVAHGALNRALLMCLGEQSLANTPIENGQITYIPNLKIENLL